MHEHNTAAVGHARPLAVARDAGKAACLFGLAVRRIAGLSPGDVETAAKDSAVIADAARTLPPTLRSLELTVLVGFDQDLGYEAPARQPDTRPAHRIHPAWNAFSAPAG